MEITGSKNVVYVIIKFIYSFFFSFIVPTVQLSQSVYSVNNGGQVTLGCTVTSTSQVTSVFWQRNVNGFVTTITSNTNTNKYSGSTVNNPSLTIFNSASSDAGTYTCFASNGFGTGTSTSTSLTVGSKSK